LVQGTPKDPVFALVGDRSLDLIMPLDKKGNDSAVSAAVKIALQFQCRLFGLWRICDIYLSGLLVGFDFVKGDEGNTPVRRAEKK